MCVRVHVWGAWGGRSTLLAGQPCDGGTWGLVSAKASGRGGAGLSAALPHPPGPSGINRLPTEAVLRPVLGCCCIVASCARRRSYACGPGPAEVGWHGSDPALKAQIVPNVPKPRCALISARVRPNQCQDAP